MGLSLADAPGRIMMEDGSKLIGGLEELALSVRKYIAVDRLA